MREVIKTIDRPHWAGLAERASKIEDGYLSLDRNENLDTIYNEKIVNILKNEIDLTRFCRYADYCK